MKLASIVAFAVLGSGGAFIPPKALPATSSKQSTYQTRSIGFSSLPESRLLNVRGGSKLAESSEEGDVELDADDAASLILSMIVIDAVAATKDLALNWGFVMNSGIVNVIGGLVALAIPVFATSVAYETVTLALACVAAFNIAGLFSAQNGFKLQSFLVGSVQAFLAYRMRFQPFESLNILTIMVAIASMADGAFETAVALRNSQLPGRWSLLFSGLASIGGGAFVAMNLPASSLVVLGVLLGINLVSSGWSGILAALQGREIANAYLMNSDFEKDAYTTIVAAANAS